MKKPKHPINIKQKLIRFVIHLFGWIGVAVIYYFAFSFFFDTPVEYGMKRSIEQLENEYGNLNARYDTVERVLNNVEQRDRQVFKKLFDSYPLVYNDHDKQMARYDSLLKKTNRELAEEYVTRVNKLDERMRAQNEDLEILQKRLAVKGKQINRIPSIQPVIDKDLTQIATSYGMRIHPFFKTLVQHQGMDYAVPEGTRVFATADGMVSNVQTGRSNSGLSITISHSDAYETNYNHLSKILVSNGAQVKRGDIIALSGNTGLSLAPHLHYEVKFRGMRVDPVNYFFYELSPQQFEKVKRVAAVGMQSFD